MIPLPFDRTPPWVRALRAGGLVGSVLFHGALAWWAMQDHPKEEKKETWVEMAVVEAKPPPPPPPPPPPEPDKPKPKPKPVEFKETVKQPPPEAAPPPEQQRVVRRVQGLSASSFAQGSGAGFDARAGTTLGMKATNETLTVDEASKSVSYAAATTPPRLRYKPPLEGPEALKANDVEGTVNVLINIDAEGRVTEVSLAPGGSPLGFGAEEACLSAWRAAKYSPAKQGDVAVPVKNIPNRCTFKAIE